MANLVHKIKITILNNEEIAEEISDYEAVNEFSLSATIRKHALQKENWTVKSCF